MSDVVPSFLTENFVHEDEFGVTGISHPMITDEHNIHYLRQITRHQTIMKIFGKAVYIDQSGLFRYFMSSVNASSMMRKDVEILR